MNVVADGQKDILSIEAPIHWVMEGVRQSEVETGPEGPRIEAALRAMVAVRPELLMLSAIPDTGTAMVASQLASSRLVVGAMIAPSAASALVSRREMGVPTALLAGSLGLVTGQRLVRVICRICSTPVDPPPARTLAAHGIDEDEAQQLRFFRGQGCPRCNRVGYRGRAGAVRAAPGEPRGPERAGAGSLGGRDRTGGSGLGDDLGSRALPGPRQDGGHVLRRVRSPEA